MTDLGPEWVPDNEGVPSRKSARLLVFDSDGNILLIRGHDTHDLEHRWWFTVGGGLEPGEEARTGALREAAEETGLRFDPESVEGPVLHRKAEFHFRNVMARQEELFFIARIDGVRPKVQSQNLTALELETLDEFAWFSPSELVALAREETVYPLSLPDHVAAWHEKWDGTYVVIAPEGGMRGGWDRDPDPR